MFKQERKAIDRIDKKIVRLWEERMQLAKEISLIKAEKNMAVMDKKREKKVLEKLQTYLEDPSLAPYLVEFYQEVMRISRKYQVSQIRKIND